MRRCLSEWLCLQVCRLKDLSQVSTWAACVWINRTLFVACQSCGKSEALRWYNLTGLHACQSSIGQSLQPFVCRSILTHIDRLWSLSSWALPCLTCLHYWLCDLWLQCRHLQHTGSTWYGPWVPNQISELVAAASSSPSSCTADSWCHLEIDYGHLGNLFSRHWRNLPNFYRFHHYLSGHTLLLHWLGVLKARTRSFRTRATDTATHLPTSCF